MIRIILGILLNITPAQAIIGGTPVSIDDQIAKSTVLLYGENSNNGGFICSGTILNNQYILSAAHCVIDVKLMLVLFTNNAEAPGRMDALIKEKTFVRGVVNVNYNIDYPNATLGMAFPHNDIALIRFSGGIPAGFKPVTLLNPSVMSRYLKPQQEVIIAGFGQRSGEGEQSGTLYKNRVRLQKVYSKTVVVGEAGSSSCHGDSGGPAFISVGGKLYQWGVLSRGEAGCVSSATYTPLTSNFYGQMATP